MTELKPIKSLFAVEVPDKASLFEINNGNELFLLPHPGHSVRKKWTILPPGSYEILFTTSDVTEQKLAQAGIATKWLFLDILSSNNLDPNKNYLLIKRNEQ